MKAPSKSPPASWRGGFKKHFSKKNNSCKQSKLKSLPSKEKGVKKDAKINRLAVQSPLLWTTVCTHLFAKNPIGV
jgi:hypothetical protein